MLTIQVSYSRQTILLVVLVIFKTCSTRHLPRYDKPTKANRVFVIGADGLAGKAAVSALSSRYGEEIEIRAGVSDPSKAKGLKKPGVKVVPAEFGARERLQAAFKHVDSLYLTNPRGEDRVGLVIATAQAAKEAGVKHILLYSLGAAADSSTVLGREYAAIETAVRSLGVPLTVFRLSLFMENFLGFIPSIKTSSIIRWPVDPTKQFTTVTMVDVALAAAMVLVAPEEHTDMTYTIVSDRITFGDVAEAFTTELGRPIAYERISYEDTVIFLTKHGFDERYAKAIMEVYQLVDIDSPIINHENLNDFQKITGAKPTTLSQWVARLPLGTN